MATYLLMVNFEFTGAKNSAGPGTRLEQAFRQAVTSAGGTVETFHFAFGGTDSYVIAVFPDHVAAAAVSIAVAHVGGARVQTVVLLTAAEVDAAVANPSTWRPPLAN